MPRPAKPHKQWDVTGTRIPVRTCVVSRERRPQSELLRVVHTAQGWQLDPKRRIPGRGAYISPDRPELHTIKVLRRLARAEAETLAALLELYRRTGTLEVAHSGTLEVAHSGTLEGSDNTANNNSSSRNTVQNGVSKQERLWKNKLTEVTDG
jgi:hypothetical protein